MENFSRPLVDWYKKEARPLPWREELTPYRVWVSEIMLQQTRIEAAREYFNRFTRAFPTVEALAAAELDDVLKLWEGLGYYSRARNLHKCAKTVCETYGGVFPPDAAALRALTPEERIDPSLLAGLDAAPEDALTREELKTALDTLFDPETVEPVLEALPETESEYATRAEFAFCVSRLLGKESAAEDVYYPDVAPTHWASAEVLAAAGSGTLTKESLESMTRDGFLWFGGYLYRLGDDGYFLTDSEFDGLYFDKNGRYTSGSAELDDYVAQTLSDFMTPDAARLDDLKAIYYHVKNDFQYLTRNYYDSGATGWDIDEALTIFRTNKGNCYCYAGAFCALARGLGYNARTYSGSIGIENQPHAWTEITLDGKIYICDPEIEMNYWLLQMYTDNFMMLRENSLSWNYQSVGRT